MCAIVGSRSKEMMKNLFEINSYRGQLSYSICSINQDSSVGVLTNDFGILPERLVDDYIQSSYYIGHTQAPTTESKNIHPARCNNALLWHNGIVKQKELAAGTWDTEWILKGILAEGFKFLSCVDGTYACILHMNNKLYVFRNEISPLFVDDNLNLSSTKFEGSISLKPNTVFEIDLNHNKLVEVDYFETKENPYFFG